MFANHWRPIKRKALEAQPKKTGRTNSAQIHQPTTAEYPSPPGVEGAPGSTRAQHPRAEPHRKLATGKNANGTQDQAPKSQDRCLVYAAVYRLYGMTELEIGIVEGGLIRTG